MPQFESHPAYTTPLPEAVVRPPAAGDGARAVPGASGSADGQPVLVFVLDAQGRVVAADAASAAFPAMRALRWHRRADFPALLRAAGEGTAALAIANALASQDGRDVVFTVHDVTGGAHTRWRLVPIPRLAGGSASSPAWTVVVEREPVGVPGRREAETLAAIARELARVGGDGSAALAELARGALALFDAAGACVVTFEDPESGAAAHVAAAAGSLGPLATRTTPLLREPLPGADVARAPDVTVINDAEHDPRVDPGVGVPFAVRQLLAAPLVIDGRVAAHLCVVNVPQGAFAASDVELVRRLADHGALALRNVRLLAARALAQARAEAAAAIAQIALDAEDAASGATKILDELDRVVPSSGKLLSVTDRERGTLRCLAAVGDPVPLVGRERPLAETIQHDVLARGELVDVPDLRAAVAARGCGVTALPPGGAILVPIMTHGVMIGDLCVHYPAGAPFALEARDTLRLLGPSVGVAMDVLLREERERTRADEERRRDEQLRQAEKLAALGELVAGVAHEMNNPLAGISAFAELLLEEAVDAPFGAENREAVRLIKREADRAKAVVRDLLTFAREAAPSWGPVAIDTLLERTVRVRAYAARNAGLDLRLDAPPGLPPVRGDERKLQQVFINLIANAEHAVRGKPAGERQIVVQVRRRAPDRVAVRVRDTGIGIPPELLGRVFEPFFTTKPPGEGTGLGLSVSYGIVQAHGGELRAHNLPGGGAAFDVVLPVDSAATYEAR